MFLPLRLTLILVLYVRRFMTVWLAVAGIWRDASVPPADVLYGAKGETSQRVATDNGFSKKSSLLVFLHTLAHSFPLFYSSRFTLSPTLSIFTLYPVVL